MGCGTGLCGGCVVSDSCAFVFYGLDDVDAGGWSGMWE